MDVIAAVYRCGLDNQGQATAKRLRQAGLAPGPLARAVEGGAVIRLRRRVYALSPLPARPRFVVTDAGTAPEYVAHVRAALLSLGGGAAARGRTAAVLYRWALLVEPSRSIEVAVPHGSRRVSLTDVVITECRALSVRQVRVLPRTEPLAVTAPEQTVLDCARALAMLEAVVLCDSALREGDVQLSALRVAARSLPGRGQAARVRRVLDLCDPESGSVLESVLRVRMVLDGIAGFATQQALSDSTGRHVLRADFVFEGARLVVEVDGQKWHQDVERDRRRDNQLAVLGWRVLRFRWTEVVHHPASVLQDIREAAGLGTEDCQFGSDELLAAA
jgi:very-short-patch-repair endonuclease